jgi:hypothetical protein
VGKTGRWKWEYLKNGKERSLEEVKVGRCD